jgi:anaerobic selenocysteine-containing dehydrogenase
MVIEEKYTFCPICVNHCALKVKIEDGKVVDVSGAGETGFPVNICSLRKGALHIQGVLNNPDRLKYPLKREGERGEGKWKRLSWDEALDIIARKLLEVKEKYGPERVAILLNEPKGMEYAFWQRFATAFGTPNVATPACYCGVPTGNALRFTFGTPNIAARMVDPKVIVVWGANIAHTGGSFIGIKRSDFNKAILAGCKIVVIDPRNIELWPEKGMFASDADYWLRPRPNSDGILAMGMIKVIIEEDLYDKEFVDKWTIGFDKLRDHVTTFTLGEVEKYTWVPKDQIREVAVLYATNKPGIIAWGNGLEGSPQAFQTCRAIAILKAICGNVNTPYGGEVELAPPLITPPGRFMFSGKLRERLEKFPRSPERTIGGQFKLALRNMYIPVQALIKALLEEKPYAPKVLICCLTNPLASYPDTKRVYEAFMKADFIVVIDVFHTPTTMIADIVLPAAYSLCEYDSIAYWPAWACKARAHPKLVDPPGECWPDPKIVNELAKRVGLREYFWEDWMEALDYMLEPAGLTWEKFRDEVRYLEGRSMYDPNKVVGFDTPSGKVEIYSKSLEEMGYSPMPTFQELLEPLTGKFEPNEEYPLVMTCYKSEVFFASGFRNVRILREKSPPPTVIINPETAKSLGLEDGDWAWIETRRGRARLRVMTDPGLHPRVVVAEFGWWEDSNINLLTDCDPPYDPFTGSVALRGYPCKVYKA